MMGSSLGIGGAAVELTGRAVVDLMEAAVVPRSVVEIPPRALRQALLVFQSSVHGRIPEILGDDPEERVETLVALLEGTSEDDLNMLLSAAFEALRRLEDDKLEHQRRRGRRQRLRRERMRSVV
jgi:hypothetical protein